MAEVELDRPTGYRVDHGRGYRVHIDGRQVGSIKVGETKVFSVEPGHHELQLKQDWAASEKLSVDLGESDRARFVCAPRIKQNEDSALVGVRVLFWATLGCRRYIDLRHGSEIDAPIEPGKWQRLRGPALFGIALLLGLALWALMGQSILAFGIVVGAVGFAVGGTVGRGVGRASVHATQQSRKRRTR